MSSLIIKITGVVALIAVAAMLMGAGDHHSGPAMNYHAVNDKLATGGHFVDDGIDRLDKDGLEVVIDLRPEDADAHRANVEEHGIEYVHVPVSWEDPASADFERFAKALKKRSDQKVLVQCAANYRASAMTYLYRTLVEGTTHADARADLEAVWSPNRRWRQYIATVSATFSMR